MIKYIKFKKNIFGRRSVVLETTAGERYKIKTEGEYAVILPPCSEGESVNFRSVYKAAWGYLNGDRPGTPLDRTAKIACGRLVKLMEWPEGTPEDVEYKLHTLINKFTFHENIF